ncbi:MAG: PQQ-like beta-propeller repeat protein [Kiritimatiellaeota bacterium]|nr:PQQ-like beta-propeller repeat protein [Kiritimatiellota bacterium]
MNQKSKRLKVVIVSTFGILLSLVLIHRFARTPDVSESPDKSETPRNPRFPRGAIPDETLPAEQNDCQDAFSNAPVLLNDGTVLLCSDEGVISVLDAATGETIRSRLTGESLNGIPAVYGNTLFVGGSDGVFRAFELSTLKTLWSFKTNGKIAGGCVLARGKNDQNSELVVFGSYDFKIRALRARTGKMEWKLATGNFVNGSPKLVGNELCVGGCDGKLRFVDSKTGELTGVVDLGSYIPASPAVSDSACVVALYTGEIIRVDAERDVVAWRWSEGGKNKKKSFTTSPVIIGERVFAVSTRGECVALSFDAGKTLWRSSIPCDVEAQPIAVGDSPLVVDADGTARLIEMSEGRQTAEFALGEPVSASPAALEDGGFIVATENGLVTALRIEKGQGRKPRVSRLWSRRLRFHQPKKHSNPRAEP